MITNEEKQIIANILLETDYINCTHYMKRQIRERIAQRTGLTERKIFDYIHNNKDKLFQQAENRLENINPTIAPRKKRVYNFYTDEQKQIITKNLLEINSLNSIYTLYTPKKTYDKIVQETGLTKQQLYRYICTNKDKLFQQVGKATPIMQNDLQPIANIIVQQEEINEQQINSQLNIRENLIQESENRLENVNPTIVPREKRVRTIYTDERKQIIANILLERDFIKSIPYTKKQIRERIVQETGLTERQVYQYFYCHKNELFQQAENRLENTTRLKNTTSPTQHRISIPQNITQSDDQLELHNISQALEEFSESKSKIKYLSRISQELGDELSINASFSNMCDY